MPVVAVDARYGPREIVTLADLGELAAPGGDLAGAIGGEPSRAGPATGGEPVRAGVRAAADRC